MSMREVRYNYALNHYQKELAKYEERRQSIWFRLRFPLRYGGLKKPLLENRATLFEFENQSYQQFEHRNVLFKAFRLGSKSATTGLAAWSVVAAEPGIIALTLTCGRCGFRHLICVRNEPFYFDAYIGMYKSAWFEVFNPAVWDKSQNVMVCQSCKDEATPLVKRFPHNLSLAKPKHPGSPDDPAYGDR